MKRQLPSGREHGKGLATRTGTSSTTRFGTFVAAGLSQKEMIMNTRLALSGRCHRLGAVACAAAVLLLMIDAAAQNLFVSDYPGSIYQFTPSTCLSLLWS